MLGMNNKIQFQIKSMLDSAHVLILKEKQSKPQQVLLYSLGFYSMLKPRNLWNLFQQET